MSQKRSAISEMDRTYFNQYDTGYSPYAPADLNLILDDLVAMIEEDLSPWICEIGSADGQFSVELARRLSHEMSLLGLDIAEQVLKLYPFHKLSGSAFQMPLANSTLGLVCYVASLHHLAPFEDSLTEMKRVLMPGGLVYFMEPNYFHPQRRLLMNQRWLYQHYRQANDVPVNPDELRLNLIDLGFEVVHLRYINLHFKSPGLLQTIQNTIAQLPWPPQLARYINPWFVLIGKKR